MVFRYTPIGRTNQDRRQSATPMVPKRQRARQLLLYGPPILLTLIVLHVFFGSEKLPFRYKFKTADLDAASGYTPGTLGKRLLSRQRSVIGSSSTEDWEVLFSDPTEMAEDMFDLMAGRDEDACAGWGVEKEGGPELESRHNDKRGWDSCWRAKMHEQIGRWKMEDSKFWPALESLNKQSLSRLSRCLADPSTTLNNIYPAYTSENPFVPLNLTDVNDLVEEDTRPCSLTSTKVILGNWWYFTMAFADWSKSPGESVWLRNQMRALYELGYTVVSTNSYKGMVEAHKAMPDVISHIWTEDRHTLACQDDPRCLLFSTFKPTNEKYPGTGIDEKTHKPDFWDDIYADPNGEPPQRWAWLNHELSAIPEEERGTIPGWKLFTTTYWGARPEDPDWDFTREEFPWNSLGQQWTLTPFDYPHHTYIPYSIEATCLTAPVVSYADKSDRVFVLAKQTAYFQDPWSSVPTAFWATVQNQTGMNVVSVAEGDEPLPAGIESHGQVAREEFEVMVSESKVMLGIGRPLISPSVYSALCQGTPVVMPYFKDKAVPAGWDLFNGGYAQHGPAAAIGPPYVYSYKSGNETDLVDKLKKAMSTPISRFIPEDMTFESEIRNMDDFMRFDWETHGEMIRQTGSEHHSPLRRHVVARCFKIGRCQPINGDFS